jgi:hypothetical protein
LLALSYNNFFCLIRPCGVRVKKQLFVRKHLASFLVVGTFSLAGMLDAIEEIAPNRRKEVNSMKVAIPFLAALLF